VQRVMEGKGREKGWVESLGPRLMLMPRANETHNPALVVGAENTQTLDGTTCPNIVGLQKSL
jgi:hypothetical protein